MATLLRSDNAATGLVHPFESAGLGVAPFVFVGMERRVGPIRIYDADGQPTGMEVGSPGQPMGTCAFCGTGIAECCHIRDANGRTFIVGNECVRKTADAKLVRDARLAHNAAERKKRQAKRDAQWERDQAKVAAIAPLMARDDVRSALASQSHPVIAGKTRLDWAEWMLVNAGMSGRLSVVKFVSDIAGAL